MAVKEVAAEVGLAQSSVHERIRHLRDAGVLRGAHADVDPAALGIGLEAILMLGLARYERGTVENFLDELTALPEVRFAYLVTGHYDVIVNVLVRDMQHLKDLALDNFTNQTAVSRIETSIVFDARHRHVLPVYVDSTKKRMP